MLERAEGAEPGRSAVGLKAINGGTAPTHPILSGAGLGKKAGGKRQKESTSANIGEPLGNEQRDI
jgi:hypothetical protein